jgi:hypothetical protein
VPPLPPVDNVVECILKYGLGIDTSVINRIHIQYTGTPPSDAVAFSLAEDVYIAWSNDLSPGQVDELVYESVQVTDLSSISGGRGLYSGEANGANSGTPIGAATSLLINHQVGRRYRGGKPRTYVPGLPASDLASPQRWATGTISNWTSYWQAFIEGITEISEGGCVLGQLCSVSYYEGFTSVLNPITGRTRDVPKLRTAGPVVDPVISFDVNPAVASQRRRNQTRS